MPIANPAQAAGEVQRAIAPGADVRVEVDEGPVAPNGLVLKFLAAGRGRIVTCVQYEDERGLAGWWDVRGVTAREAYLVLRAETPMQ